MVVLVSDIHFGSHEEGALDALMKAVTRDVDGCVVIAGDLTQDSRLEVRGLPPLRTGRATRAACAIARVGIAAGGA